MRDKPAWTPQEFRRVITKAGRAITCSWGVAGIRDRKTGQMATTLFFNDNEQFAYAFAFNSYDEVRALCEYLMTTAESIRRGDQPRPEEIA